MKPTKFTVFEFFERERRYAVPLFQRPYVWDRELQWEPLWLDIRDRALALLAERSVPPPAADRRTHFLGAVVLSRLDTYGRNITTDSIIDGQQRLTTLQVFLGALRDYVLHAQRSSNNTHPGEAGNSDPKLHGLASTLRRITENDCSVGDKWERFKVWPTNSDRTVFESVMSAGSRDAVVRRHPQRQQGKKLQRRDRLADAYLFFYDCVDAFTRGQEDEAPEPDIESTGQVEGPFDERGYVLQRLDSLMRAIRQRLQLVTIELEDDDDPQVIFETLNGRMTPLLPSDLIRNFVFLQVDRMARGDVSIVDRLYAQYWQPFDEEKDADSDQRFWMELERQGRLERPRLDLFLFHYLTMQTAQEINIGHLFQEFRNWWVRGRETAGVEDELARIKGYGECFQLLYRPEPETRLALFVERLRVLDTTTVYPLLMYLLGDEHRPIPEVELAGLLTDLESFLVRRMICRLTTKNYNRLFLSILKKLRVIGASGGDIRRADLEHELLEATGVAGRWPDNKELAEAFIFSPAYELLKPHRVNMVLRAIEAALRTSKQERIAITGTLDVEHVLPRGFNSADYPLDVKGSGPQAEQEAEEERRRMLNSFGNLTLLSHPLNVNVGNGPFRVKRSAIALQSALRLNSYFQQLPDTTSWDHGAITSRALDLLEVAVRVWPHPRAPREHADAMLG